MFNNVRKSKFDLDLESEKIKYILGSDISRCKFEALLLLECKDVEKIFGLTAEEIQEFKDKVFDTDALIKEGRFYIITFLERERNLDVLRYFIRGEAYTKARAGISSSLAHTEMSTLFDNLVGETILDGIDLRKEGVEIRSKAIKAVDKKIEKPKQKHTIDRLSDLFRDEDI